MTLRPPLHPITAEFYRQLPEGPPYYELIEGNLIMSPAPSFYHQKIALRLARFIDEYLDEHALGEVAISPSDVYLTESNVLQPDVYFVSAERLGKIGKSGVDGAPDLVIEILSPSNATRDRNEKRLVYLQAGVREVWLADPETQEIEIYPLAAGVGVEPEVIRAPSVFEPSMFPGLRIDTGKVFKPLD